MSFAEPDGGQRQAMLSLTGQLRPVRAPRIKWRRRFSAALRRAAALLCLSSEMSFARVGQLACPARDSRAQGGAKLTAG